MLALCFIASSRKKLFLHVMGIYVCIINAWNAHRSFRVKVKFNSRWISLTFFVKTTITVLDIHFSLVCGVSENLFVFHMSVIFQLIFFIWYSSETYTFWLFSMNFSIIIDKHDNHNIQSLFHISSKFNNFMQFIFHSIHHIFINIMHIKRY